MLILMLRALLLYVRAKPPLVARLRQRGKRNRPLQREQRAEGQAAAPAVGPSEGARR